MQYFRGIISGYTNILKVFKIPIFNFFVCWATS